MKISKWPFFCCKNMADNKYRSANTERRIIKNTRKLKMQGGRYETKKDGKGGCAPS